MDKDEENELLKQPAVSGMVLKDKYDANVINGSIINMHQTINGEKIFVVLDAKVVSVEDIDVRYGFDLSREYEYSVTDLFSPSKFTGEVEFEIVGNIYSFIKTFR